MGFLKREKKIVFYFLNGKSMFSNCIECLGHKKKQKQKQKKQQQKQTTNKQRKTKEKINK